MDNYYIENKETGKLELHFDKASYMALSTEQKSEIKSNFLFSRYNNAWVSRCKFPNLYRAEQVAKSLNLENAGTTGEKLSFEEQMEVKAAKAESRADRYEYKASQAVSRGQELQKPITDMHGDIAFFTQPNINSASGRAFTRKRDRMWSSFERGMEEFRKSEYYKERAETARNSLEMPTIDFCQRRIDEANASIRKLNKSIEECEGYLMQLEAGETELKNKYGWAVKLDPESIKSNIDRWEEIREDNLSKIAYYDSLIQQQGGINFSKDNIKPGYIVELRASWKGKVLVVSTGPKNFKYKDIDGTGFDLTASYSEIVSIIEAKENNEILHPFKVGETFTVKVWTGHEYSDKEYTITKIAPDKVTVKSGAERAKAIKPRKTYNGDAWELPISGARNWYYKPAKEATK